MKGKLDNFQITPTPLRQSEGRDTKGIGEMLMIKPSEAVSSEPVIDELTRRMAGAWKTRRTSPEVTKGLHFCACGACSDNKIHWVRDQSGVERQTNALAVHYLAFHRKDIPADEIEKVRRLPDDEIEPTAEELHYPPKSE